MFYSRKTTGSDSPNHTNIGYARLCTRLRDSLHDGALPTRNGKKKCDAGGVKVKLLGLQRTLCPMEHDGCCSSPHLCRDHARVGEFVFPEEQKCGSRD